MGELRSPGKLKHSPPMRRSRLEMAKVQVRGYARMHKAEPYATLLTGDDGQGDDVADKKALRDGHLGVGVGAKARIEVEQHQVESDTAGQKRGGDHIGGCAADSRVPEMVRVARGGG